MRIVLVVASALLLAGCAYTTREQNTLIGATIGAGTGALIGSASSGPPGGWAGAAIGGVTGGLIGYLVTPPDYYYAEDCYRYTRRGKKKRVAC
jgi:hypothetical protein